LEVAPQTTLDIRVLPRSCRNEIVGKQDNIYRIKLTAPAIEGKANKALITLLSKRLGLPKAKIQLISGERSRTKTIRIQGLPPEQVEALLISD
jgi:uncharacterized protein (TIGR00251 family)